MPSAAPVATDAAVAALDALRREYRFRGGEEVADFLLRPPESRRLLAEARPRIAHFFGSSPVDVELVRDPEAPADPELFALVRTRLSSADALRQLRRFDEGWWLQAIDGADAAIVVSVEHV